MHCEPLPGPILHVDMDAFFASVEVLDHPEWKGQPLVVGAPPDRRGVVSAASYEARRFGIHSAMPSRTAAQRCPQALFVPVRMERYLEMSARVMDILQSFTPQVEQVSVDEAFLDVAGVKRSRGTAVEVATALKAALKEQTGLTASVGVAPNKFLAKLASDLDKPDGLTVVPVGAGAVAAFLAPLPVERIWGVGRVTARRLQAQGLPSIGSLQHFPVHALETLLSPPLARHLHELAWGRDERPVITEHEAKSLSREHTFNEDCEDPDRLRAKLVELVEQVAFRLRRAGLRGRTAQLKIRDDRFVTRTRQQAFGSAACSDRDLLKAAVRLFEQVDASRPVRLIGFGVADLCDEEDRLPETGLLFPELDQDSEHRRRDERLDRTVDQLKERFGKKAVRRGGGMEAED